MNFDARNLRLRATLRDEPYRAKLIEWVLGVAEARHRAWIKGEPDPYGLPLPVGIEPLTLGGAVGAGKFPGPSVSPKRRAVRPP